MIFSRDRILTTHVGSLPRNETLTDSWSPRRRASFDPTACREMDAVRHVVAKQMEAGIDIGNDGEQQRVGFQTYVPQRMSGFAGVSKRRRGREYEEFPELLTYLTRRFPHRRRASRARRRRRPKSTIETSADHPGDCRLKPDGRELHAFSERFMTAPSPGIISTTMLNAHYESHEAYLNAIAREMGNEYLAINKAGLVLQIDSPDLAMDRTMMYRDLSDADFVKRCESHVAAINKGSRGFLATASGCMSVTATGKVRTSTTSRSIRSCRCCTRPRSARCPSNSPIRATPTNMRRSSACRSRKT